MPRPALTSRDDLTDALIRVVVAAGLDAVSIRTVAREAGVSIGTVQYHFATKDDLLLAAYQRAIDQVALRAGPSPPRTPTRRPTSVRCCASCSRSTNAARPSCASRSRSARAR